MLVVHRRRNYSVIRHQIFPLFLLISEWRVNQPLLRVEALSRVHFHIISEYLFIIVVVMS